jgi:hypothetical protein
VTRRGGCAHAQCQRDDEGCSWQWRTHNAGVHNCQKSKDFPELMACDTHSSLVAGPTERDHDWGWGPSALAIRLLVRVKFMFVEIKTRICG